ncbi:MAG: hypothetical protein AAGF12_07900 [Myxococcota bacterium]
MIGKRWAIWGIPSALVLSSGLVGCGDDDDAPIEDATVDASTADAVSDRDGPDAFVRLPAPDCRALPPVAPPACGSGPQSRSALVPGPAEAGHDAALAAQSLGYDRGFHALFAMLTGVNTEVRIADPADRETIRQFFEEHDGWDLEAFAGKPVTEMATWNKAAGAYAGVGAAADAFRYAVLRDEGAACEDVDRARGHVIRALDGMHRATAITGVEGVIARGYLRRDVDSGATIAERVVPLFDDAGNPLPEEKNNGTFREDNSIDGAYSDYIWEDSCSRDMLIGWVVGMAALWEVIQNDPTFDQALKDRLAADARAIARSLMVVGESGFDLEIPDADGRLTFHAFLNEAAIDRFYLPDFNGNAQHAVMSLGIMAALGRVSADEEVLDYVYNDLVRARDLPAVVGEFISALDAGVRINYSNYNMAFDGAWLAGRYLCDDAAADELRAGVADSLYTASSGRGPASSGQSFFDVVYVALRGGASVGRPIAAASLNADTRAALDRGTATLRGFPAAPYWGLERMNCDAAELAALRCTLENGMEVELLEQTGHNDVIVATTAIPIEVRQNSNFHWRSNPFRVNAPGSVESLLPAVDFRFAYWMGRYLTVE